MENRKRRSSLRKAEDAVENTIRLKRRISFSGKKLIREFSKEAEAQKWNHSYEVSDKQDENSANTVCDDGTLNKTNEIASQHLPNKTSGIQRNPKSKPNDSLLKRENSFDITLFEHESNGCKQNHDLTVSAYEIPCASFTLVDHEKDVLMKTRKSLIDFENTVDYLRDLSATGSNLKTTFKTNTRRTVIYDEDIQLSSEIDFEEKKSQQISGTNTQQSGKQMSEMDISANSETNKEDLTPSKIPCPRNLPKHKNVKSLKPTVEFGDINSLSADFERKLQRLSFNLETDEVWTACNHENKENLTSEVILAKQSNKTIILNEDIKSVEDSLCESKIFQNEVLNNDMELTVTNIIEDMKTSPCMLQTEDKDMCKLVTDDCAVKNILDESAYQSSVCICSPVTNSPLVPPELVKYSNRKLNCRQIMEDIEQGKLQIYKDPQRTPLTGLNSNRSVFSNANNENSRMPKVRATLYFDEEIVPVEESSSALSKLDINDIEISKLSKKNHKAIRFSQAGEMLLNNTNFLTHAKLGDETASCNNSKNSILSRRETLYLDEEIPCEVNEIVEDVKCAENIPFIKNGNVLDIREQQLEVSKQSDEHKQQNICTQRDKEYVISNNAATNNEILENDKQNECNLSDNLVFSYILDEHLDVKKVEKTSNRRLYEAAQVQSEPNIDNSDKWNLSKRTNIDCNVKQNSFISAHMNNSTMEIDDTNVMPTEKNESKSLDCIVATSNTFSKNLTKKISTGDFIQSAPITPRRPIKMNLVDGTPHRSLIEFEYLEKECDGVMILNDCSFTNIHKKQHNTVRTARRNTNTELRRIECGRFDGTPTKRLSKIHRLTNIVSCNMDFDNSMNGRKSFEKSFTPIETTANKMRSDSTESKYYNNFTVIQNSTILEDNPEVNFDESKKYLSSNMKAKNNVSMKRLPIDLTPLIINSKKRQTILYKDCDLELDSDNNAPCSIARKTQLFADDDQCIPTDEFPKKENDTTKQLGSCKELTRNYVGDINISTCEQEKHDLKSMNLSVECDFDTIQIPRYQTMRNPQNASCLNTLPTPLQKVHDSFAEKDAITISDVSVFYQSRQSKILTASGKHLSEKDDNNISYQADRGSDTELQKVACFNKKFINCTSDSMFLSVGDVNWDDIDKTRLSLVETLSDEEVEINNYEKSDTKDYRNLFDDNDHAKTKHKRLSNCRKCKRCQETLSNETTNIEVVESFHIPNVEMAKLNLDRLTRLRQLPNLKDSREYWRRIEAERAFNREQQAIQCTAVVSNVNEEINVDGKRFKSANSIIGEYKADIKEAEKFIRSCPIGTVEQQSSFVLCLQRFLEIENLHNWIFDFQLQNRQTFLFTHKKITTIHFLLPFEPVDDLGQRVLVRGITMAPSRFKKKYWSLLHSIIEFQLAVDFSLIPPTINQINNESGIFEMLKKVDSLCESVHTRVFKLFRLVCKERAALRRYENIIYLRKIVYNSGNDCNQLSSVEKCEFLIEIKNINNVCFRDIRKPHLYEFKNEIELLPSGFEFLSLFLSDPCKYLK